MCIEGGALVRHSWARAYMHQEAVMLTYALPSTLPSWLQVTVSWLASLIDWLLGPRVTTFFPGQRLAGHDRAH